MPRKLLFDIIPEVDFKIEMTKKKVYNERLNNTMVLIHFLFHETFI